MVNWAVTGTNYLIGFEKRVVSGGSSSYLILGRTATKVATDNFQHPATGSGRSLEVRRTQWILYAQIDSEGAANNVDGKI